MTVPISDYVNLSISTGARGTAQASLEMPMLIGYHTEWTTEMVREYSSIPGLEADGFASTDPIHKMATALLSQDRRVERFKVGRRANAPVQAINVTVTGFALTDTVKLTIRFNGLEETYSVAGTGAAITTADALVTAITNGIFDTGGAAPDYIAASNGGASATINITNSAGAVTGQLLYYDDLANCTIDDATPDPGLAADITAIRAEDDDWYCALLDSSSGAENAALATALASTAPNYKICGLATQDSDIPAGTAGNLALVLSAASRNRAFLIYSPQSMDEYPACAWAGERLPYKPAQSTWMYKLLRGVTAANNPGFTSGKLSTAELTELEDANCNVYVYAAGAGDTRFGTMCDGSFIDDQHLLDYLAFRIPEEIMSAFRNPLSKIPYTNQAAKVVRGLIYKVCATAATWGALQLKDPDTGKPTFSFSSTIDASDQASADIASRIFRGIEWGVLRTGAVHKFYINGSLTDASAS